MSALSARDIRVSYGQVPVLDGVDLDVAPGEVVALLGPSGAGKSTLFRVLSGELTRASGEVRIADQDVSRAPLWRRARAGLGYMPQTPSVLFDLSVADNVATFERLTRASPRALGERLLAVGLDESFADRRASELSGGERRRLELLRTLIAEPKIVLLDEPLTGVDPAGAELIGRVVRQAAERGAGVLVADHRVREALAFADRAALLLDGAIRVWAEPEAFEAHPQVQQRYLG
ncbi:MAG: ATP-binding cassette domain-containing protein [Polyangiaceae bacterium]